MTKEEAAEYLNGREYRNEVDRDFERRLKESGLLAVMGASDDIMCVYGVTNDEFYGPQYLNYKGVAYNECEDNDCPYYHKIKDTYPLIIPIWPNEECFQFKLSQNIPYSTFKIMEDDEVYCIGMVIDTADLPE